LLFTGRRFISWMHLTAPSKRVATSPVSNPESSF